MPDILRAEHFEISQELDLVVFSARGAVEKYSYQLAFNLAQDIRLHCKAAMQTINEHHSTHRTLCDPERFSQILSLLSKINTNKKPRFSNMHPEYRTKVGHVGELIQIHIGSSCITMPWEDALRVSVYFRAAAKQAKSWAGDTSSRLRVSGLMHDASR